MANAIGPGGDQYVGLDQFGRIANQNWVNSTGTTVDGYTYTYDSNGNVLSKNNALDSAYSETYTYDSLNRLAAVTRGGASYQNWNLDSQGNWSSFTSNGSTQTRTANGQNQITSISGAATPSYDGNGNMVSDQNGDTLVYDAWNRLVEVKNSGGQIIAQYTYNAQGYMVSESYPQGGTGISAGQVNYLYYTSSWQLIEVRSGGTANSNVAEQIVWSAAYINAAVLQDTFSGGIIQPNFRLYFLQDVNWNTTAVVGYDSTTQTWNVVQRYVYSPYGNLIILNPDFTTAPTGTLPLVNNLYQGMAQDPVTGLYYGRARWYSPSLGTWISQDPAGYINGADTYQFVMGNPVASVDTLGSDVTIEGGKDHGTIKVSEGFDLHLFGVELFGEHLVGKGSYSVACVSGNHANEPLGLPHVEIVPSVSFLPPSGNVEITVADGPYSGREVFGYSFPAWDVMAVKAAAEGVVNYFFTRGGNTFELHAEMSAEFTESLNGWDVVAAEAVALVAPEVDLAAAAAAMQAVWLPAMAEMFKAVLVKAGG